MVDSAHHGKGLEQQKKDRVIIFDTTLRDGEQSPGATMTLGEKLELASALSDLGVDVIEAGFPAASPGDFAEVQAVARKVEGASICGLARCVQSDIEKAYQALKDAAKPRIHVFLATSAIHREFKLKMAKEEIVARACQGIRWAKEHIDDVEFSPEDAARTELDFLAEVVERAIEAGARTINIPDTVGYAVPQQMGEIIGHLKRTVSNIDKAVLSVHCHNDLGLAVGNSLAALQAGARQVECTINGIGERAGNCALEELVMALHTRSDYFSNMYTGIKTPRLGHCSRLTERITGIHVQRNKAIVGKNAFAHEAGIHQHGMLANASTYEIMRPEDVGAEQTQLVLGKHSGSHAFRDRVAALGYSLDEAGLKEAFAAFKELADRKKEIYDADIEALLIGRLRSLPGARWDVLDVQTGGGSGNRAMALVRLEDKAKSNADGRAEVVETSAGDGPIDAVFWSLEKATQIPLRLREFQVRSVTLGKEAQGEAYVVAEHEGQAYTGRAVSTDILEASARAYLAVINQVVAQAAGAQDTSDSNNDPSSKVKAS